MVTLLLCAGAFSAAALAGEPQRQTGRVVAGSERTLLLPPSAAHIASYRNLGYQLDVRGRAVLVQVELGPIESEAPFHSPSRLRGGDRVDRLAWALTADADTVYGASSRILDWVARNIHYDLDRTAAQDLEALLDRRTAYCTGIARLTVALLERAGIEAREVPGWVTASSGRGGPQGYHRWVEIHFPDRGWVYSDPLWSHFFVPSTYVRLDSTDLRLGGLGGPMAGADVVDRHSDIEVIDESALGGPGVLVRPNVRRQRRAALRVVLEPQRRAWAILEGAGVRRRASLEHGVAVFVGLDSADYVLSVEEPDATGALQEAVRRKLRFSAPTRQELRFVGLPTAEGASAPSRASSSGADFNGEIAARRGGRRDAALATTGLVHAAH